MNTIQIERFGGVRKTARSQHGIETAPFYGDRYEQSTCHFTIELNSCNMYRFVARHP